MEGEAGGVEGWRVWLVDVQEGIGRSGDSG